MHGSVWFIGRLKPGPDSFRKPTDQLSSDGRLISSFSLLQCPPLAHYDFSFRSPNSFHSPPLSPEPKTALRIRISVFHPHIRLLRQEGPKRRRPFAFTIIPKVTVSGELPRLPHPWRRYWTRDSRFGEADLQGCPSKRLNFLVAKSVVIALSRNPSGAHRLGGSRRHPNLGARQDPDPASGDRLDQEKYRRPQRSACNPHWKGSRLTQPNAPPDIQPFCQRTTMCLHQRV